MMGAGGLTEVITCVQAIRTGLLPPSLGLTEQEGYAWGILRSGLASVADTFIAQLQDYLGLGAEARMNTPGTLSDRNWSWRLQPGLLTAELAHRLRRMNTMYERL